MEARLTEEYQLKSELMGPDEGQVRELKLLNRILTWTDAGIQWEADPRHVEMLVKQLGLAEAKVLNIPMPKDLLTGEPGDRELVGDDGQAGDGSPGEDEKKDGGVSNEERSGFLSVPARSTNSFSSVDPSGSGGTPGRPLH